RARFARTVRGRRAWREQLRSERVGGVQSIPGRRVDDMKAALVLHQRQGKAAVLLVIVVQLQRHRHAAGPRLYQRPMTSLRLDDRGNAPVRRGMKIQGTREIEAAFRYVPTELGGLAIEIQSPQSARALESKPGVGDPGDSGDG